MKKFILLLGLGLGLLATKNHASSSACYSDGCHVRNGVPWEMFFFDKEKHLIGSLPGDSPHPIVIPESSFPVYVSGCKEMHNPQDPKCTMYEEVHMDPGCHVVWSWLYQADPDIYKYYFTWWSCWVGKEKGKAIQNNPPKGAITSKSAIKSAPQKSEDQGVKAQSPKKDEESNKEKGEPMSSKSEEPSQII